MIFDTLENLDKYAGLNQNIIRVLEEAKKVNTDNYPKERIVLDGDKLFINCPQYDTHELEGALCEAHQNYVDVFVMIDGEEIVYVKNIKDLKKIDKPYNPEIDALLTEIEKDSLPVVMKNGTFLVLFPEDVHGPGCNVNGVSHVKKLIGKVLLEK